MKCGPPNNVGGLEEGQHLPNNVGEKRAFVITVATIMAILLSQGDISIADGHAQHGWVWGVGCKVRRFLCFVGCAFSATETPVTLALRVSP